MKRFLICASVLAILASSGSSEGGATAVFDDVAENSGVVFTHFNGMTGEFTIAEITGQGAGVVDIDNDGDLDLYLVQGALLGADFEKAVFPWKGEKPPRDRLFRNDSKLLQNGEVSFKFTDITEQSGIRATGYGMGVAAADYDNDGDVDLYITNLEANQLYRNKGDGTFEEVTDKAGVGERRWSTCAAFFDYDRDGHLDLFVSNYVDFEKDPKRKCYNNSSSRDFCGPDAYNPVPDRLYRNKGDGTFEDVTVKAGVTEEFGAGFGVVAADLNGDTWIDIYVANDGDPNQLWINQGDGTFVNEALWAGAAVNLDGSAEASMGLDAADFDGDGDQDIFMTHIMEETNTLYVNDGTGLFEDRTAAAGLSSISLGKTGFGTGWFDYDNDGWLDLLILNGAVRKLSERVKAGDPYPLGQPNHLLHNLGNKKFAVVSDQAGSMFPLIEVSRGAAFGDIDNDGDMDVLVSNNNGPARLLINTVGNKANWIGLQLNLDDQPRAALGALVEIVLDKGPSMWRRVRSDGSFCSTRDPRLLVGLGASPRVKALRVTWPDGKIESFGALKAGQYHTLRQGSSKPAKEKK